MIISFLTSCLMTASLKKTDLRLSHYNREFIFQDNPDTLANGICSGIEKVGEDNYYHLQYDNLLIGKNRSLDIYLPEKTYGTVPIIKETKRKINKQFDVLGCAKHYFCMDENTLNYRLFYPALIICNEQDSALLKILKINNPENVPNPFITCELDLSNVFESKINALIWKKDLTGNWKGERLHYFPTRPDKWFEPRLRWKKRSRIASILIKPLYIVTLAVDLVTLPVQLFILKGVVR